MAGREHDAAIYSLCSTAEYRMIHLLGTAEANVSDRTTPCQQGTAYRLGKSWAAQAYVPAKHKVLAAVITGKGQGNAGCNVFVEGFWHLAADIIGGYAAKALGHLDFGLGKRGLKNRGNAVYACGKNRSKKNKIAQAWLLRQGLCRSSKTRDIP